MTGSTTTFWHCAVCDHRWHQEGTDRPDHCPECGSREDVRKRPAETDLKIGPLGFSLTTRKR